MSRPSTSSRLRTRRRPAPDRDRRAHVGEQAEILAQPQQPGLRPHVVGHLVPFRPADRAEDHGVGGLRLGHGRVGDGDAVRVIGAAADQPLLGLERADALLVEEGDEALDLGHDFGADAVAGEQKEIVGRHWYASRGLVKAARIAKGPRQPWQLATPSEGSGHRECVHMIDSEIAPGSPDVAARPHVVIIGAGFGGLAAATALRAPVDVTVIDRQNHHCFQPLLYQVATAALSPAEIAWPIRAHPAPPAQCHRADGGGHRHRHRRKARAAPPPPRSPYDYLVVATGATHSYFGHDEWAQFAPGLKRIEDATRIRRSILLAFERAEAGERRGRARRLLTFVIIGGGATGVEMAGAIAEIARTRSGDGLPPHRSAPPRRSF